MNFTNSGVTEVFAHGTGKETPSRFDRNRITLNEGTIFFLCKKDHNDAPSDVIAAYRVAELRIRDTDIFLSLEDAEHNIHEGFDRVAFTPQGQSPRFVLALGITYPTSLNKFMRSNGTSCWRVSFSARIPEGYCLLHYSTYRQVNPKAHTLVPQTWFFGNR